MNLMAYEHGSWGRNQSGIPSSFRRGPSPFFVAMTAFFAVVWLAFYVLMIYRH